MIRQRGAMHHEQHAVASRNLTEVETHGLQQFRSRAFHEIEIVGVKHHAARVSMLIINAGMP
jgi:hypothetical protein